MTAAPLPTADRPAMTHRAVLEAMSGLLLGLFVAFLTSTVVSAALPRIITDLGGGQSAYTWVITSTLLALSLLTHCSIRRAIRSQPDHSRSMRVI